jgi:hypothetical protein
MRESPGWAVMFTDACVLGQLQDAADEGLEPFFGGDGAVGTAFWKSVLDAVFTETKRALWGPGP